MKLSLALPNFDLPKNVWSPIIFIMIAYNESCSPTYNEITLTSACIYGIRHKNCVQIIFLVFDIVHFLL